jgi:hypothetical protein
MVVVMMILKGEVMLALPILEQSQQHHVVYRSSSCGVALE